MSSFISLPIWLGLSILAAVESPPSQRQQPPFRVFADLKHTGILAGPLTSSPVDPNDFGIAVPLKARNRGRNPWPERLASEGQEAERLGRLRVETTKAADDVVIAIESDASRSMRLFRATDGGWRRLAPCENSSWTLVSAQDGTLEIGVGVMMPEPRPGGPQPIWPRTFTVLIATKSQSGERFRVPFRVAPLIIPSAFEPADELLIVSQPITADSVDSVREFTARMALKLVVLEADEICDQWLQDAMEPGIFAFPAADGRRQARACLTGLRKASSPLADGLDQRVVRWLRRQEVVTLAAGFPRKQSRWIDGYGNLEVTPPHTDRRKRGFPYGRLITGKQGELTVHPGVLSLLEAQAVQWPPIVLDTSWLAIGHVDEVVNFVPANTKIGFKVLLPSPQAGRAMLQALLAKGLEEAPVFEGTDGEMTLRRLWMTVAQTTENFAIDDAVARVRDKLKDELNLADSDFVMMPALFDAGMAVIPNAVNSVLVKGHLLVAEPLGPRHEGRDGFEQGIRTSLSGCDVRVVFIDAWNAYHTSGGAIHCGTNTFRRLRDPAWWKHIGTEDQNGKSPRAGAAPPVDR